MEDKKIVEHQNIPEAKTENEVDQDVGIILPSSGNFDVFINHFMNPTTESSQTTQLVDLHLRDNINQSYDKLKELALREKAANSLILSLDQINEIRQKGWWESIDKFSADDITKFETWLGDASFMLNYNLKKLKNEATSSSLSQQQNADY